MKHQRIPLYMLIIPVFLLWGSAYAESDEDDNNLDKKTKKIKDRIVISDHDLGAGYTSERRYLVDLANQSGDSFVSDYSGRFYLTVSNMVPSKRSNYVISLQSSTVSVRPFIKPSTPEPEPTSSPAPDVDMFERDSISNKDIESYIDKALQYGVTREELANQTNLSLVGGFLIQPKNLNKNELKALAEKLSEIVKKAKRIVEKRCEDMVALKNVILFKAKDSPSVAENISKYEALYIDSRIIIEGRDMPVQYCKTADYDRAEIQAQTTYNANFSVVRNKEYNLTVSLKDQQLRKLNVKGKSKSWLTHVGFTFIDDINDDYLTREMTREVTVGDGDEQTTEEQTFYQVTKVEKGSEALYAATALFTYPFDTWSEDLKWGVTTGLGASSESVLLYLGVSLVVRENLLISVGPVVKQFTVLNDNYTENQDVGDAAVDSSQLTQDTYKNAWSLTIGYRFGQ